jgi:cytoskeletal protein CcmA (bactofilin family)
MWKQQETPAKPQAQPDIAPRPVVAEVKPVEKIVDSQKAMVMDLGKSMVIKGELSASEDLTLYGRIEGSVALADHTLTIGPEADVRAAVTARSVVILGAVTGNVIAKEKVEIRSSGSVLGDVISPRLAIAEGGCLNGKIEMPQPAAPKRATA